MHGMRHEDLTERIIGAAIQVHRLVGPGLLESAYELCLDYELRKRGIPFVRQLQIPLVYESLTIDGAYRVDFIVEGKVVVEVKSIAAFARIHTAQLITYLRMTGCEVGLLINFNVPLLPDGIKRVVL